MFRPENNASYLGLSLQMCTVQNRVELADYLLGNVNALWTLINWLFNNV